MAIVASSLHFNLQSQKKLFPQKPPLLNSLSRPNSGFFSFPLVKILDRVSLAPPPSSSTKHRRGRSLAINGSEKDPNRKAVQDEEVQDLGVRAALSMLKFYKREISPLLPSSCRYVPTCSEYSMIAYKKYGVAKGTILTAWRLCRCNPFGGSGFDPPRWFDEKRPPGE